MIGEGHRKEMISHEVPSSEDLVTLFLSEGARSVRRLLNKLSISNSDALKDIHLRFSIKDFKKGGERDVVFKLRNCKALVEKFGIRITVMCEDESDRAIEPNVFNSGVTFEKN